MKRIDLKHGNIQRKTVLAYHEFIRQTGSIDPMSQPEKLPPAFASYYHMGRRHTDPVEDFLACEEFVEVKQGEIMLMSRFRDLYKEYRIRYELGREVKWGEDQYRTPFSERGIVVRRGTFDIDGVTHTNVEIVIGLNDISRNNIDV